MGDLPVPVESVALPVGAVRATHLESLVPVEPQPPQPGEDVLVVRGLTPLGVGVVGAKDERSALVPGEQPVVDRRPDTADVEVARRRRGEPDPDRHDPATTGLPSVPIRSTA